jgi:hypothetical protein
MKNIIKAFLIINLIINGNLAVKEIKKGSDDTLTDDSEVPPKEIKKDDEGYAELLSKFDE